MSICKKCGSIFTPSKGFVNYCSKKCVHSRGPRSEETKSKIRNSLINNDKAIQSRTKYYSTEQYLVQRAALVKLLRDRGNDVIINSDFNDLSIERKKKRVLIEQEFKCLHCGVETWNDKMLNLQLDHIDGNSTNNSRENLRCLCPNCHSQTDTYAGRNKRKFSKKVSDDLLYKALLDYDWNMRAALHSVGISAQGGNYKRCHDLKRIHFEYILNST